MTSTGAKRWAWVYLVAAGVMLLAGIALGWPTDAVWFFLTMTALFTVRGDLLEFAEKERGAR